jgi:hypothetical protein
MIFWDDDDNNNNKGARAYYPIKDYHIKMRLNTDLGLKIRYRETEVEGAVTAPPSLRTSPWRGMTVAKEQHWVARSLKILRQGTVLYPPFS